MGEGGEEKKVGCDWVCWVSQPFWDEEDWCPPYRLIGLGPLDQDLKTWGSHEDVPSSGVPQGVELGNRWRCQVRLPEHAKNPKVKYTSKAGPRAPTLGVMVQR